MAGARPSRGLGGDGAWLAGAKLWFLLSGYAVTVALTHLISAADYGRYYVIARLIAVPNMVIIYTLMFTVSRPLAGQFERGCPDYSWLRGRGFRLALLLGGAATTALLIGAPWLARVVGDGGLTAAIRVVAPISVVYATYAINLGTLNAVRKFRRQAMLDIAMAGSKAGFIIAAAAVGLGLEATVGGFTLASVLALCLSAVMVRGVAPTPVDGSRGAHGHMGTLAGALIPFTLIVNLLQSIDVLMLNGFATSEVQRETVGFYASAQQIALVPYSLMNAVSLMAFPLIASIDAVREPQRARHAVAQTGKISLVILALLSSVGSASAREIQALLFPGAYAEAADQLRLLVWGFSGYSFAVTVAWVLSSSKRSMGAVMLVLVPLLVVIGAGRLWIPNSFTAGAATAVAVAGGVAALAAWGVLAGLFEAAPSVWVIVRVALCAVAVEVVAALWPTLGTGAGAKLMIVAKLATLSIVFMVTALVSRTVTLGELEELRRGR